MKKKVSYLLVTVLLVFVLAACSGGGSSQQGASGAADASGSSQQKASGAADAAGNSQQKASGSADAAGSSQQGVSGAADASGSSADGGAFKTGDETADVADAAKADGQTGNEASISFETTDLDGNPVSSADIFSRNKITMVNIWGTFCGPCINEMPDLEVLNQRIGDKGCALIGVVIDADVDHQMAVIQAAEEIIGYTGVSYLNLLPWEGVDDQFPAQYIPTTYFVDSNGNIVGEAAVGSRGADDYEALIDEALSAAGQ